MQREKGKVGGGGGGEIYVWKIVPVKDPEEEINLSDTLSPAGHLQSC